MIKTKNEMKALTIYLAKDTDLSNISINNVLCAVDSNNVKHTNQYLKPEGGLYKYKDYVNYLVKRFGYKQVHAACNGEIVFNWRSKTVVSDGWTVGYFGTKKEAENFIWGFLYNNGLQCGVPEYDQSQKLWSLKYEVK